jgi:hypothetical protein
MKTKFIINYLIFAALIIMFSNCGKKVSDQKNKVETDSLKPVQNTNKNKDSVTKDNLSQNIKEYIVLNYPGYKIEVAASDPLCEGGNAIDVGVIKNGQILSLIFKPDGTFVQKEEDVTFNSAPNKVKAAIKTKYGSYKASDTIERLTLPDNTTQYLIDLTKDTVSKEVILTTEGIIICEH